MTGYNDKSCNAIEKAFYTPLEAAIRWCNLIAYEVQILNAMDSNPIPQAGQFPQWPCLRVNAEKIMDAIDNGNLRHGRDGKTVEIGDHVARPRRTVRHTDLKEWMAKHYPNQKPDFLFDETERNTHAAINADSFRALQADRDALQTSLTKKTEQFNRLSAEHDSLLYERESLRSMVEKHKEPAERSETSYLKIIIGMAVDAYRYDPKASRNTAIPNIESALIRLGIPVSDDTIRNKLKEAAYLLPPEDL